MTNQARSGIVFAMKKIAIFLILVLLSSNNAFGFWVWSPKTQKFKNPKYSPLVTPFLQLKEGEKTFEKKKYQRAFREFKKILMHYPDSKEAAEAQYYLGRCLEEMNKPYQAFLEYTNVIEKYPNSKRINEVVERQYKIGEYFLSRAHKQWLGVSIYDFVDHPAVEIFTKIVEKSPYSKYAAQAQYKLGLLLTQLKRYDEGRDAFQKVIENYPDSEWAPAAKYQLAITTAKGAPGEAYDTTSVKEATERLDEFIKEHPEADIASSAIEQLDELKSMEAKKNFDIAQFYEKQKRYESACIYYGLVIDKYPGSHYAKASKSKLKQLEDKVQ